jgi:hypothetical protein
MFDSLDEQMKHDDQETTTPKQRIMKWALVAVTSVVLFAGLYLGVRLLE